MIETEPRPEDSRALSLALALDRAGTRKDLSARLRVLVGTENQGRLLAATHQAESVLALKAAEGLAAVAETLAAEAEAERVVEPAEKSSPESDEAIEPVEDVKAMADGMDQVIGMMISQARKFIAAEPDAPDVAAMRAILASLEKLGGSEQTETDAAAKKAAAASSEMPAEMPAEVRDHLGKHKRMVSKYGAAPMSEWAAEMGIEQQQASGGN